VLGVSHVRASGIAALDVEVWVVELVVVIDVVWEVLFDSITELVETVVAVEEVVELVEKEVVEVVEAPVPRA